MTSGDKWCVQWWEGHGTQTWLEWHKTVLCGWVSRCLTSCAASPVDPSPHHHKPDLHLSGVVVATVVGEKGWSA